MVNAHRRNGSAAVEYIAELGWDPDLLCIAGVGVKADDAHHFKEIFPKAHIVGFEPNPHSCAGLAPTFPGPLYNYGLGDSNTTAALHYRFSWKNGSSFLPPTDQGKLRTADVEIRQLDQFNLKCNNGMLWLDCEGYELKVLGGAEQFLKSVKAINIEITGRPRGPGWAEPREVHHWLTVRGFYQVYVHTIRTVRSQFDAIYLRKEIIDPKMVACLDTLNML